MTGKNAGQKYSEKTKEGSIKTKKKGGKGGGKKKREMLQRRGN